MKIHIEMREAGQGLVEYALVILLVAIALAAGVGTFGTTLHGYYQGLAAAI